MGFDMNAFSLAGKKAIVTGGAKKTGLCYGMAVALPVQRLSFWTQIHRLKTRWQNWVAPNLDTTPW